MGAASKEPDIVRGSYSRCNLCPQHGILGAVTRSVNSQHNDKLT